VIRYEIPEDGEVTLNVFDVTGREIATLVDEFKRAGTYEVWFDASSLPGGRNLSSGVYFYDLKSGGFSERKKMVLLK